MKHIVFDIETGPLPEFELTAMVPPFDPAEVKTGNLKDPEKIAAKLAEAEANHRRDFIERAALDPLTGRVLAIGTLDIRPDDDSIFARLFLNTPSPAPRPEPLPGVKGIPGIVLHLEREADLLVEFWAMCVRRDGCVNRTIGFNTHLFDLPFLVRRSWKLGVPVPSGIRHGRYWAEEMVDLRDIWQLGDRQARGSLDVIAKHLGAGVKNGRGADFANYWQTDRALAVEYLRHELELTAKVATALGVL